MIRLKYFEVYRTAAVILISLAIAFIIISGEQPACRDYSYLPV